MSIKVLQTWEEQLRRGGLELAILLVLSAGRRYGLEIISYLKERTDLVVTEGTIYPILGRLTRLGLLEAEWSAASSHPRKYYNLSSLGRQRLEEMVAHWRLFAHKIDSLMEESRGKPYETQ